MIKLLENILLKILKIKVVKLLIGAGFDITEEQLEKIIAQEKKN